VDAAVNQAQLPLAGRTAIVTGAGGGIGRGIALALGNAAANVVIAARRTETGEPVASEIRAAGGTAICVRTDVTDRRDIDAAVGAARDTFGGLDVMVHNALGLVGRERDARIEHLPLESISELTKTTTTATLHCAQAAFADLRRSRGRYIVVSSTAGLRGNPVLPVYSMVKAAQRGMAKALAWEWAPHGITVNIVNPVARTDAVDALIEREPEAEERMRSRILLGFMGEPDLDVGSTVAFLASDGARYLTGHTFLTDGGTYLV
jgi:NAD(P)-dependent dehydrogenase (short-subunit alcohol dehydrogenase family)